MNPAQSERREFQSSCDVPQARKRNADLKSAFLIAL